MKLTLKYYFLHFDRDERKYPPLIIGCARNRDVFCSDYGIIFNRFLHNMPTGIGILPITRLDTDVAEIIIIVTRKRTLCALDDNKIDSNYKIMFKDL